MATILFKFTISNFYSGNNSFIKFFKKLLVIGYVICTTTVNQPSITWVVICCEACCNKKLLLLMLLDRCFCLFMLLWLANLLHMSNSTTFPVLNIRPAPTLSLWMIDLFPVWAGWIGLILTFLLLLPVFFFFLLLFFLSLPLKFSVFTLRTSSIDYVFYIILLCYCACNAFTVFFIIVNYYMIFGKPIHAKNNLKFGIGKTTRSAYGILTQIWIEQALNICLVSVSSPNGTVTLYLTFNKYGVILNCHSNTFDANECIDPKSINAIAKIVLETMEIFASACSHAIVNTLPWILLCFVGKFLAICPTSLQLKK